MHVILPSPKKADEEGFAALASLFRATAKAEEIHARNHSDVIRKMGATPALNFEPIEVKSTHHEPEDRHC
jgi:rubrerythrin